MLVSNKPLPAYDKPYIIRFLLMLAASVSYHILCARVASALLLWVMDRIKAMYQAYPMTTQSLLFWEGIIEIYVCFMDNFLRQVYIKLKNFLGLKCGDVNGTGLGYAGQIQKLG